jgi:hypothetical protein
MLTAACVLESSELVGQAAGGCEGCQATSKLSEARLARWSSASGAGWSLPSHDIIGW